MIPKGNNLGESRLNKQKSPHVLFRKDNARELVELQRAHLLFLMHAMPRSLENVLFIQWQYFTAR
jgi:hypothetical protein